MIKLKNLIGIAVVSLLTLSVTSCDVVKLDGQGKPIIPVSQKEKDSFTNMSASVIADKLWPKILNESNQHAKDLNTVFAIKDTTNHPVSVFVQFNGVVKNYSDDGLNKTLSVRSSGKIVKIDLGPVVLSNAIRDSSTIVSFDEFKNQVQFAKFSNAVNRKALHNFTPPDKSWVGKHIDVIGAVTIHQGTPGSIVPMVIHKG